MSAYLKGKWKVTTDVNCLSLKNEDWNTKELFKFPGKSLLLLRGLQILAKTSKTLQLSLGNEYTKTAMQMAENVFELCDTPLEPMKIKICGAMLSLSLRLDLSSTKLIEYLCDSTKIKLAKGIDNNIEQKINNEVDEDEDEDLLAINDEEMMLMENSIDYNNGCKGLLFYERYADILDSYFLANFKSFSNVILQKIS